MTASPPTTKIEILNQAAKLCGKQTASSVAAGGAFFADLDDFFNTLVSAELGSNRWRFAQDFQEISTLTTLSPSFDGWLYYWTMPPELLMLTRLYPTIEYKVFGDRLLTKTNQNITAIYCKSVPVSKWPAPFSMYIVYELASMAGISVTNSDRMLARIDSGRSMWQSRALFADSQSTPTRTIASQPYINVRYGRGNRRR